MHTLLLSLLLGCPSPDPTPSTGDTGEVSDLPCDQRDADEDGVDACTDCDDHDAAIFPGAPEICDGADSDCDGSPATGEGDVDGDGSPDCIACDEAGFWALTRDLSGRAEIETALRGATAGLNDCDYTAVTYWMFTRLDNDNAQVECVYTGRKTSITTGKPDSDDMNTEHTWPQSWGADSPPMECDLHHLFPTDTYANAQRGNNPFGVVTNAAWSEGGSKLGNNASGVRVFEPRDVHKGNVARAVLYYAMRYNESISSADRALYRGWAQLDPVDAVELKRSEDIGRYQEHPNPYVVCPGLVEKVTQ
ncbi:MAG: endonuclease [Deltaproteobacteria bacterium]|nr:endonuclease [Deltaproteobacteria bacterium]